MTTSRSSDEQRGYARGYAAGRRLARKQRSAEARERQENAFWQRAFLAALPACIKVGGWKRGDKPITSLKDRTQFARDFADEALRLARHRI